MRVQKSYIGLSIEPEGNTEYQVALLYCAPAVTSDKGRGERRFGNSSSGFKKLIKALLQNDLIC